VAIRLDRATGLSVIRLEGEIDIRCAAELKQALLDAMSCGTAVQVDLATAAGVDITAIQLLWAAQREAGKRGLAFAAAGPMPGSIHEAVRDAGFERLLAPAANLESEPPAIEIRND